jgi:hypothetical protein
MWLIAEYEPVTLFSFRSGMATSSGARTLFLPTPFAIRTALLDAAIRSLGQAAGPSAFDWIRQLAIAVRPPERIVITNLFAKIIKPTRSEDTEEAMEHSIAFREYAHLDGTVALAFGSAEERAAVLIGLLTQVNYFGKRGSFFQLRPAPRKVEALPPEFIRLDKANLGDSTSGGQAETSFPLGVIQAMDDWGDSLTFAKANIYDDEKIALHKDRVRRSVVLPYRLVRASRGFSYYERLG